MGARGAEEVQTHAEIAIECILCLDDTRLDHDLAGPGINGPDKRSNLFELAGNVIDEKYVRLQVGNGIAALAKKAVVAPGGTSQEFLNGLGLLVVQRELLGLDRLKLTDLLAGLEIQLFPGRDFITRGNHHDVALLAHVQTLLLEDDVDHLISGHVLQDKGGGAGHGIADDRIQSKLFRHQAQQGPDLAVLIVDADAWPLVACLRSLHQLVRVLNDALDFDHELIVALIGVVLPQAMRGYRHPDVVTERPGFHRGDRRAKIGHVKLAAKILRDAGLDEVDDQTLALLTNIDAGARIGQVDDDARLTVLAPPERDILQRVTLANGSLFGESRDPLRQGTDGWNGGKQDVE